MSEQDKKWEAENDARTLAEAAAIRKDKLRISAAKKEAGTMAKEQQIKATALKQIARSKVGELATAKPRTRTQRKSKK